MTYNWSATIIESKTRKISNGQTLRIMNELKRFEKVVG
jgi:hypothetical protein